MRNHNLRYHYILVGLVLFLTLTIPKIRGLLESTMVGTMLFQIPLLVVCGYLITKGSAKRLGSWNAYFNGNGIPGILLVLVNLSYWSLPITIDAALTETWMEVFKYLSLPVFVGSQVYHSWGVLASTAKAFIWSNAISMIFVMSWLYTSTPTRLCNNFLVSAQQDLGKSLFYVGLLLCLYLVTRVFIGKVSEKMGEKVIS